MNLKEAKIIITGASSGIGYETAKTLSKLGATVVISARNEDKLKKAATSLNLDYIMADVTIEEEVIALITSGAEKMGGLNVLINNAGFGKFAPLVDTKIEDFQSQWETNTKGLFLAGREAAKYFITQKYGNIINIGSTAAVRGFASGSGYVASKFAVSGLTECWRAELRPHNIRVSQVNPSEVVTDFITNAGFEKKNTEYKLKPKEIADTIVAMLSMDDLGFIPSAEVWATNPNRN